MMKQNNGFFVTTYTRLITEQAYVDGMPIFNPNVIGKVIVDKLYSEGKAFLDNLFDRFSHNNSHYCFVWHPGKTEAIAFADIPNQAFVFTDAHGGRRKTAMLDNVKK